MEKITIKSTFTEIESTINLLMEKIHGITGSDEIFFDFKLMLSEILANALIHGNRKDPDKHIFVFPEIRAGMVRITVEDEGAGFDYDSVEDPSSPANISRASGRGIFLVRSLSDRVYFNERGNSITFEKKIG